MCVSVCVLKMHENIYYVSVTKLEASYISKRFLKQGSQLLDNYDVYDFVDHTVYVLDFVVCIFIFTSDRYLYKDPPKLMWYLNHKCNSIIFVRI